MNKKNVVISALLTAALLAGCGGQPQGGDHTHTAKEGWEWNGTEHWRVCECGEKMDAAAHELNDALVCADCGAEVWQMEDGSADVYAYDQYGNVLRYVSFDAEGNVTGETRYENEYDDDGNLLVSRQYIDGVLQNEDTYILNDSGEYVLEKTLMYHDGGCTLNQYDQNGNMIYMSDTDADGSITAELWYEYAQDADGGFYESKLTERLEDGGKLEAVYNIQGDIMVRVWYDADGNVTREDTWEYDYDAEGKHLWEKQYTDGKLVYEVTGYAEFHGADYSMRYPEKIIEYNEDGTRVEKVHGSNGEVETETTYNADGSVVQVLNYIYETFEDGSWRSIKVYNGEKLVNDKQYAKIEDGSYLETETAYNEDGTSTVTTYDADGNVIE